MKRKLLVFFSTAVLVSSCSVWNNFTTYYNRYYNAVVEFEKAENAILAERKNIFEFKPEKVAAAAVKPLEVVVEKCSKILQFNANSSYVNDALFLTGKASYYQQNYLQAQRKFQEASSLKDGKNYFDEKMWLGKTELQLRNFDQGLKILDEVIDTCITLDDNKIATEALIAKVSFHLYRENFTNAIEDCKKLVTVSENDEIKAEASFQLGKIYVTLNDIVNAEQAYAAVANFSPVYSTKFYSSLELAKLKSKLGKHDEAYDLLEDLGSDNKNADFFADIDLEIGKIHMLKNELNDAIDMFNMIDTTHKNTVIIGYSKFYNAKIYDKYLAVYDTALIHYDGVSRSNAPKEIKDSAKSRADVIRVYLGLSNELKKNQTFYLYAVDSVAYQNDLRKFREWQVEDSIETARITAEAELAAAQEQQSGSRRDVRPRANTTPTESKKINKIKPEKSPLKLGALSVVIAEKEFELATHFFTEMNDQDSARFYFNQVRKFLPDSLYNANKYFTMASFFESDEQKVVADSLFNIVYEKYKDNILANEAARKLNKPLYNTEKDPASDMFLKFETLYADSNYKKAIELLDSIQVKYPASPFAAKSLYTKGYVLENNLFELEKAKEVYDSLQTKFAQTEYAKKVTKKLAGYKMEIQKIKAAEKAKLDSLEAKKKLVLPAVQKSDSTKVIKNDKIKTVSDSTKTNIIDSKIKNLELGKDSTKVNAIKDSTKINVKDSLNKAIQKLEGPALLKAIEAAKRDSIQRARREMKINAPSGAF